MEELMQGTLRAEKGSHLEEIRREKLELVRTYRKMGPDGRKILTKHCRIPDLKMIFVVLDRIQSVDRFSKEFRMVTPDESAVRTLHTKSGREVKIPLVFRTELPARAVVTRRINSEDRTNSPYNSPYPSHLEVKARVPKPTYEALAALNTHRQKFDRMEVWWIPKDLNVVEVIHKPDPMIVGVVRVDEKLEYFFDVYRWVDETVEDAYWSKEGY